MFSRGVYGALIVSASLKSPQPRRVGEAGKKTPIFPAGKVAIWIAERSIARQIYGCFEMVLFPAKTRNLKVYLQSKNFKLHLLALSTHQIHYLIPPAALKLERFASSARERNGTVEISSQSKQPRNSVRTSFGCWSICLREVCDYGVSGRRKRCGVNTAVSRRPLYGCAKILVLSGYSQAK